MSEDFDIAVKIDPGAVLPTLKKVEQGLSDAEKAAHKASQEMQRGMAAAAAAFGPLTAAIARQREALQRAGAAHDYLTSSSRGAAQGMASMAQAIQLESRMLEQATGKTKDYGFQLASLQKLHNDGRISAEQYIKTLDKMGVEFDQTAAAAARLRAEQAKQASNTIGFGGAPTPKGPSGGMSAAAGYLGFAGAASAPALIMGAGQAVEGYLKEGEALSDQYTDIANHAMKFTSASQTANDVIAQQTALAHDLRSTLGPTMNLYDSVGDATDDLGLSQRETIALTKTLGEASVLAGKSMDDAGNVMGRLSMAMTAGAGGAGEMQKILRDFPELGNALAATWETDTKGVVKLVSEGKKSLTDITQAWIHSTNDIHDAAARRKRTYAEERATFQQNIVVGIGKGLDETTAVWEAAGLPLSKYGDAMNGLGMEAKPLDQVMRQIVGTLQDQATEWERLEKTSARDAIAGLSAGLRDLADVAGDYASNALAAAGVTDTWSDASNKNAKSINSEAEALREFNAELAKAHGVQAMASIRGDMSFNNMKGDSVTGGSMDAAGDPFAGKSVESVLQGGKYSTLPGRAASQFAAESAYTGTKSPAEVATENAEAVRQANKEMADSAEEAAKRTREAWNAAAGQVGKSLAEAAFSADATWGSVIEKLMGDLARLALAQAAASIGGPGGALLGGIVSGIGGGAHGFDYLASSAAMQLPGFAHGGSMTVRAGGGVDDHLAMFKVSSGESIHVRTPQQREAERFAGTQSAGRAGGAPGRTNVTVIADSDPRSVTAAYAGTYAGERAHVKLTQKFSRRRTG